MGFFRQPKLLVFSPGGSVQSNLDLTSLSLTADLATTLPLEINLAAAQTENALEVNSNGGSGGDLAQITAAGRIAAKDYFYTLNSGDISFGDLQGTGNTNIGFNSSKQVVLRDNAGKLIYLNAGANVASAAAITPTGNIFHVTGTTNITSITSGGIAAGQIITIIFDGILTFTDGNNLVLAGNFVTTANDTITLGFDGTNWYEISRSIN